MIIFLKTKGFYSQVTIGKFASHSVIMLLNGHDFFFLLAVRLCFSLKVVAVPILASVIAVNKVTIRLGLDEKSLFFFFSALSAR